MFGSRRGFLGVGGSNGAITGSIKFKMAADRHPGMTALSRVTLASPGLSCKVHVSVLNFLTPHRTQRLRFGGPLADIVRFTNLLTYLFTY